MTAATTFSRPSTQALSLARCAVTVGLTLAVVFGLCWIGAAVGILPRTHMFISLFTDQPIGSAAALGWGLLSSLGFGLGSGVIAALVYNAFAFLQRPQAGGQANLGIEARLAKPSSTTVSSENDPAT